MHALGKVRTASGYYVFYLLFMRLSHACKSFNNAAIVSPCAGAAPRKASRGIKDVNKDNSLETTAQEHGEQCFKHHQLKEQCVFICYCRGVRNAAKAGAGGAPIRRRSWQTYEWQKVSQTSVVPPLCLFFFSCLKHNQAVTVIPRPPPPLDGGSAKTELQIQL